MATTLEQLQALRSVGENWDGYGAAAPDTATVDLAEEFAGFLEAALLRSSPNQSGLHISPTRVGGVLIEWEDSEMEHEVELNPDRCISFLHTHKITRQINTRKFSPGGPGLFQE